MNTTMITTDNLGYMVEYLTKQELTKIKKMVLGYGKFRTTAVKAGIPESTLRYIINTGYGMPVNIQKIRENLLAA